jgi:hypothetical protein
VNERKKARASERGERERYMSAYIRKSERRGIEAYVHTNPRI